MNVENTEAIIKQIFEDIDTAIKESIRDMPIPFHESHFCKRYKEIREKFLRK